jgi:hypothetical protein
MDPLAPLTALREASDGEVDMHNTTATIWLALMLVLVIAGIGVGANAIYSSDPADGDFCYGYAICR